MFQKYIRSLFQITQCITAICLNVGSHVLVFTKLHKILPDVTYTIT